MTQSPRPRHFALLIFVVFLFSCTTTPIRPPSLLPGAALEVPALHTGDRPVRHAGYLVLFDRSKHVPRWVAYRLTKQMVSTKAVKRSNRFHVDPAVDGCPSPDEYKRSGYDRGHIAAAEDMRWSEQAMQDSFSMANMTPQSPGLNRGPWKRLEERVRTWAAAFDEVYVTAGPVLTEPCLKTIGHAICVPARHFKVVLEHTGGEIKAIGFIFPQDAKGDLTPYVRSVAEVQKVTGLDFFPALPDDIEQKVEAHADLGAWVPLERGLAGSGVSP